MKVEKGRSNGTTLTIAAAVFILIFAGVWMTQSKQAQLNEPVAEEPPRVETERVTVFEPGPNVILDDEESKGPPLSVEPHPVKGYPEYWGKLLDAFGNTVYSKLDFLMNASVNGDVRQLAIQLRLTAPHYGIEPGTSNLRFVVPDKDGMPVAMKTEAKWTDPFTAVLAPATIPDAYKIAAYQVVRDPKTGHRQEVWNFVDGDRTMINGQTFVVMANGKPVTDPILRRKAWFTIKKTVKIIEKTAV